MDCLTDEDVCAFVGGALDAHRIAALDVHLDSCPSCSELVGELAQQSSALAVTRGEESVDGKRQHLSKGTPVGRYLVLEFIGGGAMGVVYAAYDPELDRKVALKLLRPGQTDPLKVGAARDRLLREAQSMARFANPNVVRVYDVGTVGDEVFIAMEFIAGQSLRSWLQASERSWREIVDVFRQAGSGLAAAHDAGLVHRDFKPENVLVSDVGDVFVTDFGLARQHEEAPLKGHHHVDDGGLLGEDLTQTGALVGTPVYMSPEQFDGGAVGVKSDQFSYCVSLYEALYGTRPFSGDSFSTLKQAITQGVLQDPEHRLGVPSKIHECLMRGLSISAEDRHESMTQLLAVLKVEERERSFGRWLAVAAAIVLLGSGLLYATRDEAAPDLCSGAEAHWNRMWSPALKQKGLTAFTTAKIVDAEAAWRKVETQFDSYGQSWTDMHTKTCRATRVTGEQSEDVLELRMECLQWRLSEAKALAALLSEADAPLAQRAVQAVQGLPGADVCANSEAPSAEMALPTNAEARQRVEAARSVLAEGTALAVAGDYKKALANAVAVAAEADKLDGVTGSEAFFLAGEAHDKLGDNAKSKRYFYKALFRAVRAHHDRLAVKASTGLAFILGAKDAEFEQASHWAEHASAMLSRIGDNPELRAGILNAQGETSYAKGDYAGARKAHESALAVWREIRPADHLDLVATMGDLADAHSRLGNYEAGLTLNQEAASIVERSLGQNHPWAGYLYNGIGSTLYRLERQQEAAEAYERSLTILETNFGSEHPAVASILSNLGNVYQAQELYEKAVDYQSRSLAIQEKLSGPEDQSVGRVLLNLGSLYVAMKNFEEAVKTCDQAGAIFKNSVGADHPFSAYALACVGNAKLESGNPESAIPYLEKALRIRTRGEAEDIELAESLFQLSEALGKSGRDRPLAKKYALRARTILASTGTHEKLLAEVNDWIRDSEFDR
tara:strand:- start:117379 stop:120243 length:2865 start_codon:yes stop_codon:yes gene_type:complete